MIESWRRKRRFRTWEMFGGRSVRERAAAVTFVDAGCHLAFVPSAALAFAPSAGVASLAAGHGRDCLRSSCRHEYSVGRPWTTCWNTPTQCREGNRRPLRPASRPSACIQSVVSRKPASPGQPKFSVLIISTYLILIWSFSIRMFNFQIQIH